MLSPECPTHLWMYQRRKETKARLSQAKWCWWTSLAGTELFAEIWCSSTNVRCVFQPANKATFSFQQNISGETGRNWQTKVSVLYTCTDSLFHGSKFLLFHSPCFSSQQLCRGCTSWQASFQPSKTAGNRTMLRWLNTARRFKIQIALFRKILFRAICNLSVFASFRLTKQTIHKANGKGNKYPDSMLRKIDPGMAKDWRLETGQENCSHGLDNRMNKAISFLNILVTKWHQRIQDVRDETASQHLKVVLLLVPRQHPSQIFGIFYVFRQNDKLLFRPATIRSKLQSTFVTQQHHAACLPKLSFGFRHVNKTHSSSFGKRR